MSANYRYLFADLLTNSILAELPLYGVSFSRRLNKPGNFTGTIGLNNTGLDNQMIIDSTIPGRTAVYIDRDGGLVWGGIIWSRTWVEHNLAFEMSAQTFESFFYKAVIRISLTYTSTDQRNILRSLVNTMQTAYPYRNLNIQLPSVFTDNIVRTVNFNYYDVHTFGSAIDYMIGYDLGFDYTIDVAYDSNGNPAKFLTTDNTLGLPALNQQLAFDYPGSISNFMVPENAAKGATSVFGVGAGEGSSIILARQTFQNLLNAGYPDLEEVFTNKDVSVQDTLNSQAVGNLRQIQVPVSVPTYEVNPQTEPTFGSYGLGDYAKFSLQGSPRFPGGKNVWSRIIGWDVTPSSSSSVESIKLVVAGEEDV